MSRALIGDINHAIICTLIPLRVLKPSLRRFIFLILMSSMAAHGATLGLVGRYSFGKAKESDLNDANQYCEAQGYRLPTAREFANWAIQNGARGLVEVPTNNLLGFIPVPNNRRRTQLRNDGYKEVSVGNKIDFFFNSQGYKAPGGDIGSGQFWLLRDSKAENAAQIFDAGTGEFISASGINDARVRCLLPDETVPYVSSYSFLPREACSSSTVRFYAKEIEAKEENVTVGSYGGQLVRAAIIYRQLMALASDDKSRILWRKNANDVIAQLKQRYRSYYTGQAEVAEDRHALRAFRDFCIAENLYPAR